MTDAPWQGDASSLVDAFRAGERSPLEELEATLAAIEASDLNCFSFLDPERARKAAAEADLTKPFGGVPTAIKELEAVAGWPDTGASLVFRDRIATRNGHVMDRLFDDGGAVPVGMTTASEFGGLNVSVTKLNGVTHNPWQHGRTVGGSSSGAAAAVIATGGDGGGSIRIPAAYTGLLGMKGTFGRITRAPGAYSRPNTVVLGNLSRSVRDAARYFDVCAGVDPHDPSTLPDVAGTWVDQSINPAMADGFDAGDEALANAPALLIINVQVTEDLARAEDRQQVLPAVGGPVPELDLALDDEEEAVPGVTLVEEGLPAPQADLLHGLAEGRASVLVEGSEEGHGADRGVVHGDFLY